MSDFSIGNDAVISPTIAQNYIKFDAEKGEYRMDQRIDPDCVTEGDYPIPVSIARILKEQEITVGRLMSNYAVNARRFEEHIENVTVYKRSIVEAAEKLSNALNAKADSMNLCGEYEEFINELNEFLPYDMQLTGRVREFELSGSLTISLSVDFSVNVEGRDLEHASETFEDDPAYFIDDLADKARYAVKWSEYEIENVRINH